MPVGASDGDSGGDSGVAEQRFLDHSGVDIVPAADDEVLGPAGDVDEAVGVDLAEITGVQPAVMDELARLTRRPPAPGSVT